MIKKFRSLHWFWKFCATFFICVLIISILSMLNWILPIKIASNTEIRGLILQNQIWEGEIRITGDLFALPTTTVTINPGTRVLISSSGDKNNFDLLPWHLKNGINIGPQNHGIMSGEPFWNEGEKIQVRLWKVLGKGTNEQPISISSENKLENIYDVNLIRIERGELEHINFSNYRRLEIGQNVLIKNSVFRFTAECAICISRGTPSIEQNSFEKGKRNFIDVGLASPFISRNKFLSSEGNGIFYGGVSQSEIRIFGNVFIIPNKKAVSVLSNNVGGFVKSNLFELGDIEIPCKSQIDLESNYIKSKIIFRNPESCQGEYSVGANFWDTTDVDLIKNTKFIGQTQNFKVKVQSILNKSPVHFE